MSAPEPRAKREFLLFVYDTWMSGMPDSARLAGGRLLGPATTAPSYDLVDLGAQLSLVPGGSTSVLGEVHVVDAPLLASLDIEKGHPLRYKRIRIHLTDGREVEAYTLDPDQARGRRRIRSGDYRAHSTPTTPDRPGSAWSQWARTRARR